MPGDFKIGRKPDFILQAKHKTTGRRNRKVGAAWRNAGGSITLHLEPFVVLECNPDVMLTLFPNDGTAESNQEGE